MCVRGSTGVISVASHALAGGNVTRGIVPDPFDDTLVTQNFGYYLIVIRAGPSIERLSGLEIWLEREREREFHF